MDNNEKLNINQYTKVLIPAERHDFSADNRLLIPFTNREKIGFANKDGKIIVKPMFAMYYGECYNEEDFIRVVIIDSYGYQRSGGKVSTYQRPRYGLINHKGEMVLDTVYQSIVPAIGNKALFTVNKDYKWGVVKSAGKEVVPFGKYDWIDGFDSGLARVKKGKAPNNIASNNKWGIINEKGEEVLAVEYDKIWKFFGKNRFSTKVVKDGTSHEVYFHELNPTLPVRGKRTPTYQDDVYDNVDEDYDDYGTHYGDFAGTYAQDVAGFSDDVIYDAFDGDPDAYWNID